MVTEVRHQCLIYQGAPSQKLHMIAGIIQKKLAEGYRCLYLNSAPMVTGLCSTLASIGVTIESEITRNRLVLSSEPVSSGSFNSRELLNKLEDSLDEALKDGYKGLWASGDMTWEFGPEKDFSKLMEYELGLEEVFSRRKELCGVCQYHHDTLPKEAMRVSLLVHPGIVISETLTRVNPHYSMAPNPSSLISDKKLDDMITTICGI